MAEPTGCTTPAKPRPIDEMVDGQGGIRAHWRSLIGTVGGLGPGALQQRARRLDRAIEDEGITTRLPGAKAAAAAWRCDALPLPLPGAEFAALEAGIAQRARLLEMVLADIYGPQRLLAEGLLPPELVFANPGFLRACRRQGETAPAPQMQLYAADLVRGPDGGWQVLADRTAAPAGIGMARENRRLLTRAMPEAFRHTPVRPLRPFFEQWQDTLQRLAAISHGDPAVAVLTGGTATARWFEDLLLSRELSSALVEPGDLSVRGGVLFLKTLQGLQRVDLLVNRLRGAALDPLEMTGAILSGVPGLLDAWHCGAVRIVNAPGAGAAEAPALALFLPAIAERLLGEPLLLPATDRAWLAEAPAPEGWRIGPALDGNAPAGPPPNAAAIALDPAAWLASRPLTPSVAPCVAEAGMEPLPLVLRMFALFNGEGWQVMPGGLARLDAEAPASGGPLPAAGLSKDVWVLSEDGADIIGPAAGSLPPLPIRRTPAALPSRIADNLFWLGRYIERLEDAARLLRASIRRMNRGVMLPREAVELAALAKCLRYARLVDEEDIGLGGSSASLSEALLRSVRPEGTITAAANRVSRMTELVRDHLTGDMYFTFTQTLRNARRDLAEADALEGLYRALVGVLRFSTSVAGVAAENMVRGGAWRFLDLGRRIERATAIAAEVGYALQQPPARIEGGLRLMLELCDSVITYRSRYLTVLQPAPALDLVLADGANPRALAFQLTAIAQSLDELGDAELAAEARRLLALSDAMVAEVVAAGDQQAAAAAALPPRLLEIAAAIGTLSDAVTRRFFALLPALQSFGSGEAAAQGTAK